MILIRTSLLNNARVSYSHNNSCGLLLCFVIFHHRIVSRKLDIMSVKLLEEMGQPDRHKTELFLYVSLCAYMVSLILYVVIRLRISLFLMITEALLLKEAFEHH